MNHIQVQQAGGFPMETDTLEAMQKAYEVFNVLGGAIASLAIVAGCQINGNQVSNGYVSINNKLYEFRGGAASEFVIIEQEEITRNFENGETKVVYINRWATFGESSTPENNYVWADFHRVVTNKEISDRLMPINCIPVPYWGSIENIPNGYVLCDGTNDTPDLRKQFIVGYDPDDSDYDEIGKTGGAKNVILTANQMPKHKHTGSVVIPNHTHGVNWQMYHENGSVANHMASGGSSVTNEVRFQENTGSGGGGTFDVNLNDIGNNEAHENRPPYFTLAWIIYKG